MRASVRALARALVGEPLVEVIPVVPSVEAYPVASPVKASAVGAIPVALSVGVIPVASSVKASLLEVLSAAARQATKVWLYHYRWMPHLSQGCEQKEQDTRC